MMTLLNTMAFINENQMHMLLYFMGFLLGQYGPAIWVVQWFMLYHNMIKDENAMKKAKYAQNSLIIYVIFGFIAAAFRPPQ